MHVIRLLFFTIPSFQEWELIDLPAKRNMQFYNFVDHVERYNDVTYIIQIRRRTLYYLTNLILPCALIGKFNDMIYVNYVFMDI